MAENKAASKSPNNDSRGEAEAGDVLSADFSVTSMSIRADDPETSHFEFALKDVRPEDGFLTKLVKLYRELQ